MRVVGAAIAVVIVRLLTDGTAPSMVVGIALGDGMAFVLTQVTAGRRLAVNAAAD